MFVNVVLRRFLPFCIAAGCGFGVVYVLHVPAPAVPTESVVSERGSGAGSSLGPRDYWKTFPDTPGSTSTESPTSSDRLILSRPRAIYTNEARANNVQGIVLLRVTLLASGQIGSVTPVRTLPDGLTEQAILAARQIKFKPKIIDGRPVSTIVTMEYSFTIY